MSSFTVNGSAPVNGAIHVQQNFNGTTGQPFAAIFSADIATGTTATIAITFANSLFNDQQLAVYSVDDALLLSTTPNTGSGVGSTTSATTSSFTQTNGGFTLAGSGTGVGTTGLAITGYTTDQGGGAGLNIMSHLSVSSTGSTTASAAWTTSANAVVVAASWR